MLKIIITMILHSLYHVIDGQHVGNATGLNYHISYLNNKENPLIRKEMLIGVLSEVKFSIEI